MSTRTKRRALRRKLDARPDTPDFRNKIYVPTLVAVLSEMSIDNYRRLKVPVSDQGQEGRLCWFRFGYRGELPFA